ncbi:hypothetical protein [Nostoc sp.]
MVTVTLTAVATAIVYNTSCLVQNAYLLLQKTCAIVHNTSCLV